MDYFLFSLKQQVSILSLLLLLLVGCLAGRKKGWKRTKIGFGSLLILLFLLSSTAYFPRYCARKLEGRFRPFHPAEFKAIFPQTVIYVLGGGYNVDPRLPAAAKLGLSSLGRLTEAVRIQKLLPGSRLMCSGNGLMVGKATQAEITRGAALQLGADSVNTSMLATPATTAEEARDLATKVGAQINLILVTDALHMPRAMRFFSAQGFDPIAAPTNYRVTLGGREPLFKWMPKLENLELSDLLLHEYLGYMKNYLTPSK